MSATAARQCPLCGQDNDCAAVRGQARCWCFERLIPRDRLDSVPAALRGRCCLCRACAGALAQSATQGGEAGASGSKGDVETDTQD